MVRALGDDSLDGRILEALSAIPGAEFEVVPATALAALTQIDAVVPGPMSPGLAPRDTVALVSSLRPPTIALVHPEGDDSQGGSLDLLRSTALESGYTAPPLTTPPTTDQETHILSRPTA